MTLETEVINTKNNSKNIGTGDTASEAVVFMTE